MPPLLVEEVLIEEEEVATTNNRRGRCVHVGFGKEGEDVSGRVWKRRGGKKKKRWRKYEGEDVSDRVWKK